MPRRKWDTKPRLLASIERAHELIGYAPSTTFADGLAETVRWFSQHWSQIEEASRFGPGRSPAVPRATSSGEESDAPEERSSGEPLPAPAESFDGEPSPVS